MHTTVRDNLKRGQGVSAEEVRLPPIYIGFECAGQAYEPTSRWHYQDPSFVMEGGTGRRDWKASSGAEGDKSCRCPVPDSTDSSNTGAASAKASEISNIRLCYSPLFTSFHNWLRRL